MAWTILPTKKRFVDIIMIWVSMWSKSTTRKTDWSTRLSTHIKEVYILLESHDSGTFRIGTIQAPENAIYHIWIVFLMFSGYRMCFTRLTPK